MKTCHDCGQHVEECDALLIQGHDVCAECIENGYKACETCGEQFAMDGDELVEDDDGYIVRYICVDCLANEDDRHFYGEAM